MSVLPGQQLDAVSRAWYEMAFRLKWTEARGEAFQDLFASVMELRYLGDFVRVRPSGSHGDYKCDGYRLSTRTIFQCYGPDKLDARGIAKLRQDLQGAVVHWKEMKEFIFVQNHHKGLAVDALRVATEAAAATGSVRVLPWSLPDVRSVLFGLPAVDIAYLLGVAPTRREATSVRFEDVEVILQHVAATTVAYASLAPPSPNKMAYNNLSDAAKRLLVAGLEGQSAVQDYLRKQGTTELGDRVATRLRQEYELLRLSTDDSDEVFASLQDFASGGTQRTPKEQGAILAVLGYFFERCDIFDPVPDGWTRP